MRYPHLSAIWAIPIVYYWWLVRDENNLDGWVAEGDQAFYFIEPMPD